MASKNDLLQVSEEFLKENAEYTMTKMQRKNGGPYSKEDKNKRRDEVYRLHFEYGYSARKIAEMMNINRNTINRDIEYCYYKTGKNLKFFNVEKRIVTSLQRLDIQQSRLREQLDKATSNSERMAIERLIFDINSKILHVNQKLVESEIRTSAEATDSMNDFLKKEKLPGKFIALLDTLTVSTKAQEEIQKIIDEDNRCGR